MPVGYYCPQEGCRWTGLACPPGDSCPRCGKKVRLHGKQRPPVDPADKVAPDGNPRDQTASVNYVLDEKAWANEHKRQLTARYEAFALRLANLVVEKQIAYGDSFRYTRDVLKLLFPNGISVERYGDLLTITRIIDKLFRVANQKGYGGENPYEDIAGYATRAACDDDQGGEEPPENDGQAPIDLV
jgi:hypothetical protein